MIPVETDLNKIRYWAQKREDQNFRFRTFLKGQDDHKIDRLAHQINKEVESHIDCTLCGNCCKELKMGLKTKEIDALTKIDHISREQFIGKYTEDDDFGDSVFMKDIPCKYLIDKKCSIYESRPEDCKSFPNIHKKKFISRTWGMIGNYGICPIVFNVMERLKIESGFR